ncbi:polyketide cyclase/dehydrase/lipid transport protein [Isoptericola sp. CG 20/1183]|uniref:Polyketide cyclase/dehydrase/lipid transport protein n=1 Tax=Isoptericola halotolerans TaxID=300560 RepID=A0ABX5EE69_9MICO|nr:MULTISPECIES: SRPBCC family protein [Isoptericola]PRZ06998.1 polyketide cyclase/dehydrase/lipid transport protein [Isoptericola halotolerans]PRZ07330.1 polyketide cyclase/dehydrase/lipid transport protein [Isoptericola sp. CG 20/1183]
MRALYVEVTVRTTMDRIWELTQDPEQHARWDLRFSRIVPTGTTATGATRFRYERALGPHTIRGTGTSLGERHGPDGTRTSALRFGTDDRTSPLRDGRGYWRYTPVEGGVRFVTGYDYTPGFGRAADRVLRPLVLWMTAWSFDRLRIWAETGVPPERWPLASVLALWRRDRPRASRCVTRRPGRDPMRDAPRSLDTLEAP